MPLKAVLTTPYDDIRKSWRWDDDATGVEFQVRGTQAGPKPHWLDLARRCASKLDEITATAMKYLRETASSVPEKAPEVRWLDIGLDDRAEIEWFATLEDDYDLWSVRFRIVPPDGFAAISHSRRPW